MNVIKQSETCSLNAKCHLAPSIIFQDSDRIFFNWDDDWGDDFPDLTGDFNKVAGGGDDGGGGGDDDGGGGDDDGNDFDPPFDFDPPGI